MRPIRQFASIQPLKLSIGRPNCGIGFSLVNCLEKLPFFAAEALGRLERMGIRARRRSLAVFPSR
jgi:hypothetical protein